MSYDHAPPIFGGARDNINVLEANESPASPSLASPDTPSVFKHRDDVGRRKLWVNRDTLHLIGIDGNDHNHGAHGGHPHGDRKIPSKLTITLPDGTPQEVAVDHTEMAADGSVCMYFNHKHDRVFVLEWIKKERNTKLTLHVTATGANRCEYVVAGSDSGGRER